MPGLVLPSQVSTAPGLEEFINEVAKQTGFDSRVVATWALAEGAFAKNGTGNYDYLNLRPAAGDVGVKSVSAGGFDQFATLQDAIASTVTRIKEPFLQKTVAPVLARGGSPIQQLQAIAVSGWDAGHYTSSYGGKPTVGGSLYNIFAGQFGKDALGGKPTANPISGLGSPGGAVTGTGDIIPSVGGIFGGVTSWITDKAAYASLYLGLVMFAVVLAIIGLLSMLGVHPRTLAARGAEAAVAA